MRIGVGGGGFMGLALAQRLAAKGHAVTVFEREKQLGGLATYHDYGPFFWDRFYHCILPSDTHLIRFLNDIGLGGKLRWKRTLTGFYVDEQCYSMSTSLEFLRFPPVTLWGKIRLALTILYCSRINDWRRLETIPVEEWLRRACGHRTYEKIWKPLLLAKLGESYRRVSAVFIWSYIKRLFSARHSSAKKEHLGHVSGGYKAVLDRVEESIRAAGGDIRKGVSVTRIEPGTCGGMWVECDHKREHFDKVVFTSPVNVLERVATKELLKVARPGGTVEYLGVVCMVLITRKPLVPYYALNIADGRIPFTGVIGMSNLISLDETAGRHITYLPKYVLSDDPFLRCPDEELQKLFFDGLRLMLPEFKLVEIEGVHINRAVKVQPLQVLNYSRLVPQVATAHEDFFVLNTSQFVNCTLNNNEVVRAVDEFLAEYGATFERGAGGGRTTAGEDEMAKDGNGDRDYFVHESSFVDEPCTIGKGTKIWHFSHIMANSAIGRDCNIGQNVVISPRCVIGDNVKIQNNVSVYTGVILEDDVFCGPSAVFTNVVNPRSHVTRKHEYQQTLVKRGATIGANATVVCGVTLGKYCFVGAGGVVTRDVPDYGMVYGNPARLRGWMCHCGVKLDLGVSQEDSETSQCVACGRQYRREGGTVSDGE